MASRLKDFRRIGTRYDRNAANVPGAVCLAVAVSCRLRASALAAEPQHAIAPLDASAPVHEAARLAKANEAIRRTKLADEQAAEFIPASRDAPLDLKARIGVGRPATIGANIVCGGRRRCRDSRTGGK